MGISEEEVRTMVKTNPEKVLGFESSHFSAFLGDE
jgi:predicted metal-dependent phosphotriesterase family hydrolase